MELQFDKEIDAILRKARGTPDLPMNSADGAHLDADVIAAFAENALPERARMQYTAHFADCGRCRKLLSQSILAHNSQDASTAAAAVVANPVAALSMPWYKGLLSSRGFATAMGTLVIAFGAMLVYFVVQERFESRNATVTQVTEQERNAAAPFSANSSGTDTAHAPASVPIEQSDAEAATTANTAVTSSDTTRAVSGPSPPKEDQTENTAGRLQEGRSGSATGAAMAEKPAEVSRTDDNAARPAPADEAKTAELDDSKDADAALALKKRSETARDRRDMPPPAAKAGPARSGPVQMQSNQVNTATGEMTVTRRVGGKTFENKDGAWYDRAYKGQETTNVRRGSDPYKKLDRGLRNIAETLSGVVVVVWKDKAYRIQ